MKLISMTDFVLEIQSEIGTADYQVVAWQTKIHGYDRILKYAHFLKQPLTLGMFVPCDVEGNVLEETEWKQFEGKYNDSEIILNKHKEAQSKVIFEGFSADYSSIPLIIIRSFNSFAFLPEYLKNNYKTIEDLIPYNLDLVISF